MVEILSEAELHDKLCDSCQRMAKVQELAAREKAARAHPEPAATVRPAMPPLTRPPSRKY